MRRQRGFTIIELTIAIALVAVLMGIVVVRFDWGGPRQTAIEAARRTANLLSRYREKAVTEERSYAMRFFPDTGVYSVVTVEDSTPESIEKAVPIKQDHLGPKLKFGKLALQGRDLPGPVTLFLRPNGVLPAFSFEIAHEQGPVITVSTDPLVNEVSYGER